MPRSRWVDFKDVKARVGIRDVLDRYGVEYAEHAGGAKLSCACPIHRGDSPKAFHADTEKNCWKCFSKCAASGSRSGGNVLDLVMLLEAVPVREAALLLQEWFPGGPAKSGPAPRVRGPASGESPERAAAPPAVPPPEAPAREAAPAAERTEPTGPPVEENGPDRNPPLELRLNLRPQHPYLDGRGVTPEAVAEFGLGYCPRGILAGRIAIPVHDADGNLVAYAGRHPKGQEPKYRLPKGFRKSLELFNLHRAREYAAERGLVVVEGFFDAVRLWQLGVRNVVAMMGTELSGRQEELLLAATDRITLMLDGDEAGRAATAKLLERLARRMFVRVIDLLDKTQPDGLALGHPALPMLAART